MKKIVALAALTLPAFILGVAVSGCGGGGGGGATASLTPSNSSGAGRSVAETGTVVYNGLEGGFYGIVGDSGSRFDPIGLAPEFQKAGLRVRFQARAHDDMASFHMWGTMIEIESIEVVATPSNTGS